MTALFRRLRRNRDEELTEEIRSHLEMAIRDRVERGEPHAQAEVNARRELGNVATITEVTREMWGRMWLERLAQDLRYAVRLLRRNPGFAAVAILSLALGIGANTAIFQVIDAVRLRTLPVRDPGELAEIRLVDPTGARGSHASWHPSLTNPIWEQIRARQQALRDVFAWGASRFNLANGGESRPAQGLWVSGGFFNALGERPAAGRLLAVGDDERGCTARGVISHAFWHRQYGGDSTLPPKYPAVSVPRYLNFKLAAYEAGSGISQLREDYETPLWLLLGTSALVLIIACANLANLLLARASARRREIAVRLGLGASRGRVIRQLLTESLLLAALGGACGALLAGTLSHVLLSFLTAADQNVVLNVETNWRVLGFTGALAVLTCVLFGLAPAVKATRISADAVMKASGRGVTADRERTGLRRSLVICQVALSLVLLVGALLFARSLHNLLTVDPGFRDDGVIVAQVDLRSLNVPAEGQWQFRRDLIDRLRVLPGVQAAGTVAVVPVSGNAWGNNVTVESDDSRQQADATFNQTSSGYFATVDIPIIGGRNFDESIDAPSSPAVAIVNETFARELLNGRNPVGASFTVEATPSRAERSFRIVGLAKDSKYMTLRETIGPGVFLADGQDPQPGRHAQILLRSHQSSAAVAATVTRSLVELDPRIGVEFGVLKTAIGSTLVRERLMATLSGFFGGLAAVLTLIGLYGLIAYSVARRTNEIGVRMALGASRHDVLSMILREAGGLIGIGIAVGLLLALAGGRAAATLLFGVRPNDPFTLAVAVAALAAVAFVASFVPARAATRIEPITALRME